MRRTAVLGFPQGRGIGEELLVGFLFDLQVLLDHDACLRNQFQSFRIDIAIGGLEKLLITVDDRIKNKGTIGRYLAPNGKIDDLVRRANSRFLSVASYDQSVNDFGYQLFFRPIFRFGPKQLTLKPIRDVLTHAAVVLKLGKALEIALLDGPCNHPAARDEQHVRREKIVVAAGLIGDGNGVRLKALLEHQKLRIGVVPGPGHGAVADTGDQSERRQHQDALLLRRRRSAARLPDRQPTPAPWAMVPGPRTQLGVNEWLHLPLPCFPTFDTEFVGRITR